MEQQKKMTRGDVFCKGGELDGKKFAPCVYATTYECDDPCNECMATPVNDNSRKPINYIPKDKK